MHHPHACRKPHPPLLKRMQAWHARRVPNPKAGNTTRTSTAVVAPTHPCTAPAPATDEVEAARRQYGPSRRHARQHHHHGLAVQNATVVAAGHTGPADAEGSNCGAENNQRGLVSLSAGGCLVNKTHCVPRAERGLHTWRAACDTADRAQGAHASRRPHALCCCPQPSSRVRADTGMHVPAAACA